jgi:hypothetical protein
MFMKAEQNAQGAESSGEHILCPHCQSPLNEEEVRTILGQFGRAKWKRPQVSRFAKMTPEERKQAAIQASRVRWAKVKASSELVEGS